jgi:gentisate 1,2-dioxygenase
MTLPTGVTSKQESEVRKAYYDRISENHLAPLWERMSTLVTPSPRTTAQPVCWRFTEVRPCLLAAGSLLSVEEAERRVLILENPGYPGQSQITGALFAGLQLLLPGDRARAHRHTAGALRLILEGDGAYTAVDGERTLMAHGDFIITPSWTWHHHGNDGPGPVIWLDGLDVPTVNLFGAGFSEHYGAGDFPDSRPAHDCEFRYGGALLPEDERPHSLSSPLLNYRYERARETLRTLHRNGPFDLCHGVKLRYANPLSGGSVMPTMSAALQLIPGGFETAPCRSTDGTVFVVVEGKGSSHVGETAFDWAENDIFVVPSWAPQRHRAESEAVLFSFSDRAAQEKLGIWREQRGASPP